MNAAAHQSLQEAIFAHVGASARSARLRAGVSRKKLAEAAGVSERYLNELEKGVANASVSVLARIAQALDIDMGVLIPSSRPSREFSAQLAQVLARVAPGEEAGVAGAITRYLDERQRNLKGVALLGLRGAGKSTLGRLLAEKHGLSFVSITREVEKRAGMGLADLFNLGGVDAYRALENDVALDLARRRDRIVLETAGGIVGNTEALNTILGAFKTVWLRASPEEHLARVAHQGDTRPMLGNPRALEHLMALLAQREPEYARAEARLDTSGKTPEACVIELERIAAVVLQRAA
ncbi:MAG TPA: shikimate kinase [Beijerinckiaceae bacterium]|nr:shikimate kinase [Beijerinckiaceae bacterium]